MASNEDSEDASVLREQRQDQLKKKHLREMSNGGVEEEEAITGTGMKKHKKFQAPRCSAKYLRDVIDGVKMKWSDGQREAIEATGFGHFTKVSKENAYLPRLEAVLEVFDPATSTFNIGQGIKIKFRGSELACVLGVRHVGHYIDKRLEDEPSLAIKFFEGKSIDVKRSELAAALRDWAGEVEGNRRCTASEYASLYVLLVFNCILFPNTRYTTPRYLWHYAENVSLLGEFAWGPAVYSYLMESMRSYVEGRSSYLSGCTTGLLAWFYERVPMFGKPIRLLRFPRVTRWVDRSGKIEACRQELREVSAEEVMRFIPLVEEKKLCEPVRSFPPELDGRDMSAANTNTNSKEEDLEGMDMNHSGMEVEVVKPLEVAHPPLLSIS